MATKTAVDVAVAEIAKRVLNVSSFEEVGRDACDFVDVARASIGQALLEAFAKGRDFEAKRIAAAAARKVTPLEESVRTAARKIAGETFSTMAPVDVSAGLVDDFLDQAIEACVLYGLDCDTNEELAGAFTDAFCAEMERLAKAAGIEPEPSGCPTGAAAKAEG